MPAAEKPIRAQRRTLLGGLPLLVALVLALLQGGTPFAHALLHVAQIELTAPAVFPGTHRTVQAELHGTLPDERPCPLCVADELPALPVPRAAHLPLPVALVFHSASSAVERSVPPLEVFCRPPPVA